MAKGQRTRPVVKGRIEALATSTDLTAAAIHRTLLDDPAYADDAAEMKERTVQVIVKEARWRDDSGDWSLANPDFTGDDAAKILPVLSALVVSTDGRTNTITNQEAGWIVKLFDAVPGIRSNPRILYGHASRYIRATRTGAPAGQLAGLDRAIAMLTINNTLLGALASQYEMPKQLKDRTDPAQGRDRDRIRALISARQAAWRPGEEA